MRLPKCNRRGPWSAIVFALLLACLPMMGGCYSTYLCDNGKTIKERDQVSGNKAVIDLPLVLDYVTLVIETFLRDRREEISHPVGLQPQRRLEIIARQVLPVVGAVLRGGAVVFTTGTLDQLVEHAVRGVFRTLEHHVLEQVGKPGPPFLFIGRADMVPDIDRSHRDRVILMQDHLKYQRLGATLDDAAGEAFDKVARLLGLSYPGGPSIQKASAGGNPLAFDFPRAWLEGTWDFSFSGLKTAVLREVRELEKKGPALPVADLAASFQAAVVDALFEKTMAADTP